MTVFPYIKRYHASKVRLIYKGSKILRGQGKERLPHQLKESLTLVKLNSFKLNFVPFQSQIDIELALRQFVTSKVLGLSFNKSIILSIAFNRKLKHPLPKEWRKSIENQGIQVDKFICALLWHLFCLYFFLKSIITKLKNLNLLEKNHHNLSNYSYFIGLSNKHGKNVSSNPSSHNIINWYLNWKDKSSKISSICHSVNGVSSFNLRDIDIYKANLLPKLKGYQLFKFILFCIFLSVYSLLFFIKKPYQALLFEQIIIAYKVSILRKNQLAIDYLFNNSAYLYRPLWTYIAEIKGSRVLFYFYSANIEIAEIRKKYTLQHSWHLMSWPIYLVWDEYQADFIKKNNQQKYLIKVVGSIWFSSSDMNDIIPSDAIAVFDIPPFRDAMQPYLGVSFEYYTYELVNKFLTDLDLILNENNIKMIYKMKRSSNYYYHKKYMKRIKELNVSSNFIEVNPSNDALQVIKKTRATISIPFTSTSIIAKLENKPSAYYDPTGQMRKDVNAAHGIIILSNIEELRSWIKKINCSI